MPNQIVVRPPFRKRGQSPWFYSGLSLGSVTGEGGVLIGGSATVTWHASGGQVTSDIVVEWDFDNDGDFDESVEDITEFVLSVETFTGRDWPSLLTGFSGPGKFRATLNNHDDRFSYFNSSSPLNAGSMSLKTGRKLRIRTSTATSPDPVLYARDRFNRADGPLGNDETGLAWVQPSAAQFLVVDGQAVAQEEGETHFAVLDTSHTDYYAQVQVTFAGSDSNLAGLVYRYQDTDNYSYVVANKTNNSVALVDVIAGVSSTVSSVSAEVYSGITVGVLVSGSVVTGYIEGVAMLSGVAIQTDETRVGVYARWDTGDGAPSLDNFYVWSGLTAEVEGIIWTGDVSDLVASVTVGPVKTVQLSGEGWLSKLATQRLTPPVSVSGRSTGLLIGNVLNSCNLANPPGPIDEGDVVTGVYAASEQDAINAARDVEETEFGFLHETNEGPIGFDARSAREGSVSLAGFSDAAGTQFGYHAIAPYDWRREVFNRVVAGVSPYTAGVEDVIYTDTGPYILAPGESVDLVATFVDGAADWSGHTRNVSIPVSPTRESVTSTAQDADGTTHTVSLPATVNANDLLLSITLGSSPAPTLTSVPSGWTELESYRCNDDASIIVVAGKIAVGNEDGTTVDFEYGDSNWSWVTQVYRFSSTATTSVTSAVNVSAFTESLDDPDPAAVFPNWESSPSTFIAVAALSRSDNTTPSISAYPSGYTNSTSVTGSYGGIILAKRLGSATKDDATPVENPGAFTTSTVDYSATAFTIAVQGQGTINVVSSPLPAGNNGAFTISYDVTIGGDTQSHTDIEVTGVPLTRGEETQVRLDDVDSQDDHNAIRTYRNPANLFASVNDATEYAQLVLDTFADDRPILSISFYANKNTAYRNQSVRRRVSDKITLVADNNAGLGVSQDFFIESISHRWSYGTTLWETTWELSPA